LVFYPEFNAPREGVILGILRQLGSKKTRNMESPESENKVLQLAQLFQHNSVTLDRQTDGQT